MSDSEGQRPLALTMGEPAGIAGDLTLMAWLQRGSQALPPAVVLDDPQRLRALAERLHLDVPVEEVDSPQKAVTVWPRALPVLPIRLSAPPVSGEPDGANAEAVVASIEAGVRLCGDGTCCGLVTNPIHKHVMYGRGFRYPGHTELLGALLGSSDPIMMLTGEDLAPPLRVVPMTVHIPLAEVPGRISQKLIKTHGRDVNRALKRDFGLESPRLALAGLNPHAGEAGKLGKEETEIMGPAAEALRAEDIDIAGPLAADSLFHADRRGSFDAILCGFHDQALLPLKTLAFERGVNITLNLPIVRTSPDHGAALSLAGTGSGDPASLIAAMREAGRLAANRVHHDKQLV